MSNSLIVLLLLCLMAATPRVHAADALSPSDQAWQNLKHDSETPPEPLKQLPDRMYTQQEIRAYYTGVANRAGAVADEAKRFYTQYPNHLQSEKAREMYFDMLHAAVALSGMGRVGELEAATAERLKDPLLNEAARFQLSLRLLKSAVSGRQYESDDAMRAELEKRALKLAHDYPGHIDGDRYLLNLAEAASPEKSAALASEILAGSPDESIKAECQGLVNRAAAVGKPLSLMLTLSSGKSLALDELHGKVVLLIFWDSASRFSPKALYAVNELYKTYHAKGLEVVGLNFDPEESSMVSTLKDIPVAWPQYRDIPVGRKLQERFGVRTLPMCWFLDKKGVLRELHGESDPMGITQKLLAEP